MKYTVMDILLRPHVVELAKELEKRKTKTTKTK